MSETAIESILRFWFGEPGQDSYQQRRKIWFSKQPEFDQVLRQQFQPVYQQVAGGELSAWQTSAMGCLAQIIVLDQFPRNMFRNQPQAFATDSLALKLAQKTVAAGFDRQLDPLQRMFVYLPFEHSENLADQNQSVAQFQQLIAAAPELTDVLDYAIRHRAVIQRFGRFPHRNAILGRASTPEEIEFLKQPGSSF